jgi:GntR family transcriptional regulator
VFDLLENRHDTPLVEAAYALKASTADSTTATTLDVDEGSAIFRIERTSFSTGQKPVDYEILHYRGDAMTFTMRLPRTRTSGDAR